MEVVVTTGAADMQSARLFVTTNKPTASLLQAPCPCCCRTISVRALKEKVSHFTDLLISSSPGVFFEPCLWRLKGLANLGQGCDSPVRPLTPVPSIANSVLHEKHFALAL